MSPKIPYYYCFGVECVYFQTRTSSLTFRLYFLIASHTLLSCISFASVMLFLAIYIRSTGCFFSMAYVMLCVSGTPPCPCRLSLFFLLSDNSNPKFVFFSASHFSNVALCSYSVGKKVFVWFFDGYDQIGVCCLQWTPKLSLPPE